MDSTSKLSELIKQNERERQLQEEVLAASQQILELKKKIENLQNQFNEEQLNCANLRNEITGLETTHQILNGRCNRFKLNVQQLQLQYEEEKQKLEEIQEGVWSEMNQFNIEANERIALIENRKINEDEYKAYREHLAEYKELQKTAAKLRGELKALEFYVNLP